MSDLTKDQYAALAKLREPFPPEQIGKLPKGAVMLDYVGHAALTARFLDVDLSWSWEPVGTDEHGLPAFDANGGLWIRLTVCVMTRLGYGDAGSKSGPNAVKEAIGDALRNAGMRFGAALDLWSKEDLTPPDPLVVAKNTLAAAVKAAGIELPAFIDWAASTAGPGVDVRSADVETLEGLTRRVTAEGAGLIGGGS